MSTFALRSLSARPQLFVDPEGRPLADPANRSLPGTPAPLGRERIVSALRTNKTGPLLIDPPRVLADPEGNLVGDPDGVLIGVDGFWCHRLVAAAKTADTRRL